MIRMVIADDHPMMREGIKSMLVKHGDLEIVGEASGGREAIELVRTTRPDILLLDLRMPDMNGPEVSRAVLAFAPATKILILTTYDSDEDILPAIEAGPMDTCSRMSGPRRSLRRSATPWRDVPYWTPMRCRR